MPLCAKEWMLAMSPERVRNVPKIVRKKDVRRSATFHTLRMPRRSWVITECMYAVSVHQGRHAAFSTGSHAQKPPQPSSSYAQSMPRMLPMERNIHAKSTQRRVATTHSSPRRPVMRAATAKANGTAHPVNPM
jgi:hypothetical protein